MTWFWKVLRSFGDIGKKFTCVTLSCWLASNWFGFIPSLAKMVCACDGRSLKLSVYFPALSTPPKKSKRLLTCSWHQRIETNNSPVHQFTNLECCKKAREPFETLFNGVLFLIYYLTKHFQPCLFILTEPRWALQPQGSQWFPRIGLFVVQARPIEFFDSLHPWSFVKNPK